MNIRIRRSGGFTAIELVIAIVILCVLGTLVAITYSSVQANNRNNQRQTDIDVTQSQLETYYAQVDRYPTLAQINDAAWRAESMKGLRDDALQDPGWAKDGMCSKNEKPTLAEGPTKQCYSYQVSTSDGSQCDNDKSICGKYTLTATLENGESYVKTSLN